MKIGLSGLLGILFIALKLEGTIDWSWLWVTAPIWGSGVLIFIVVFAAELKNHRRHHD